MAAALLVATVILSLLRHVDGVLGFLLAAQKGKGKQRRKKRDSQGGRTEVAVVVSRGTWEKF